VKQISKRLTYANVMSSIAVFLVLGGATAFAAKKIGSNEIKGNSITTGKIKKNAVTASKIKKNSIITAKIKNGAVTGPKINLATLGTVPSATTATTATSLVGQVPFSIKLAPGQAQTIVSNGAVSLVAVCETGVGGTDDRVRVLGQTSQDRSILDGIDDLTGPATFLNVATPPDEREFVSRQTTSGQTLVNAEIDQGFVMAPNGQTISVNSEGLALGLNYAGATCLVVGTANLIG
jgi:hypothetical protein